MAGRKKEYEFEVENIASDPRPLTSVWPESWVLSNTNGQCDSIIPSMKLHQGNSTDVIRHDMLSQLLSEDRIV